MAEDSTAMTLEDVASINKFSLLNKQRHALKDELRTKKELLGNMQDAAQELMLSTEGGCVRYLVGEMYVEVTPEEAEGKLEVETRRVEDHVASLESQLSEVLEAITRLKQRLYAKFRDTINLEDEDDK
eukprot:TRINITY_DN35539_c0_g1_i1.p1 TRINITY_DN35539_c0_g1~~TRINITY_DN35539_c0_g1_i1.p1  ORF type:complete len:135 (+),score=30.18 TRINITY_DN35539_c0_g1_i1:23-406(+)